MIRIENTEVTGWKAAIRSMRNAKNSWDKSDSTFDELSIGKNDLNLMRKLAIAGTDHSKYLRYIIVTCDIVAPIYLWSQLDTYKIGTVRNSCSFMHKGLSKKFDLSDFSYNDNNEQVMLAIIDTLNKMREDWLMTKDNELFEAIRQTLPSGYNQRATWLCNYQVLRNIYHSRLYHKLPEWQVFCGWIESLPYSELITMSRG